MRVRHRARGRRRPAPRRRRAAPRSRAPVAIASASRKPRRQADRDRHGGADRDPDRGAHVGPEPARRERGHGREGGPGEGEPGGARRGCAAPRRRARPRWRCGTSAATIASSSLPIPKKRTPLTGFGPDQRKLREMGSGDHVDAVGERPRPPQAIASAPKPAARRSVTSGKQRRPEPDDQPLGELARLERGGEQQEGRQVGDRRPLASGSAARSAARPERPAPASAQSPTQIEEAGADHRPPSRPDRRQAVLEPLHERRVGRAPRLESAGPSIWLGDRDPEPLEDRRSEVGREHVASHRESSPRSGVPSSPCRRCRPRAAGSARAAAPRSRSGGPRRAGRRASAARPRGSAPTTVTPGQVARPAAGAPWNPAALVDDHRRGDPGQQARRGRPRPARFSVDPRRPGTRSAGAPSARLRTCSQIGAGIRGSRRAFPAPRRAAAGGRRRASGRFARPGRRR